MRYLGALPSLAYRCQFALRFRTLSTSHPSPPLLSPSAALGVGCSFIVASVAGTLWASARVSDAAEGLGAPMSSERNPTEDEDCRRLNLLTPPEAQKTQAVRMAGFLSSEQIANLISTLQDIQSTNLAGQVSRNGSGRRETAGVWRTTYLHTDGLFTRHFAALDKVLREAAIRVDGAHWELLAKRDLNQVHFRTVEVHEYGPGGKLQEKRHYDAGSLITIDVMLADPTTDFTGGHLIMPEIDGSTTKPTFNQGDAVFFVSHKYHNVTPVTAGRRMVLVAELWEGPARTCAHRCLTAGPCEYSLEKSRFGSAMQHLAMLG